MAREHLGKNAQAFKSAQDEALYRLTHIIAKIRVYDPVEPSTTDLVDMQNLVKRLDPAFEWSCGED